MSLRSRLERVEELAPAPSVSERWSPEPATAEDVVREAIAHVRHRWDFCRTCRVIHVDDLCRGPRRNEPDPDGRWSWATWRPNRPAGVLPERADLFLQLRPNPEARWESRRLPLPPDLFAVDDHADVCDVWSGHWLCTVWEWRVWEALLEEASPEYLLAIDPAPRPLDFDNHTGKAVARSARARYVPDLDDSEPEDGGTPWMQ